MQILQLILSSGIGAGIMALILAMFQRKWSKEDRAEDKSNEQKQATINDIKKDIDKLFKKFDEVMAINSAVVGAQKAIMVERIWYLGTCYITEKKVYMDDKVRLKKIYDAYKELPQANGDVDPVMEEVEKLPIKEKAL